MVGKNIADHLDASGRPTKDSEAHRQYEGFALVVTQVCVACFGVIVRIEQSIKEWKPLRFVCVHCICIRSFISCQSGLLGGAY